MSLLNTVENAKEILKKFKAAHSPERESLKFEVELIKIGKMEEQIEATKEQNKLIEQLLGRSPQKKITGNDFNGGKL